MQTISNNNLDEAEKDRLLAILNSWHKIEFFIPYALDKSVVEESKGNDWKSVLELSTQDLQANKLFSEFRPVREGYFAEYNLYVGVFDKSKISEVCEKVLDESTKHENRERGELEGETCFARILLNEHGEPNFDEVSVSTVPWALGTTREHGLQGLNALAFEDAKKDLAKRLQNFAEGRERREDGGPSPLTGGEVLALHTLFREWAAFCPQDGKYVALLQRHEKKRWGEEKKTEEQTEEPQIDILNSFFIPDIERAMRDVGAGRVSRSLRNYLTACPSGSRIDLYSEEGRREILRQMHPAKMNRGRWFDEPDHLMSLMQQFAINTAFEANERSGIFSVNGPPGTGKTTLLRDLFAEIIVRRARVLASFETAADTFEAKRISIPLGGKTANGVRKLKPELTGFEMVVASSNNAAVNNVSQELPKRTAVGGYWHPQGYLEKTARKLDARARGGRVVLPDAEEQSWGLISCALGKSSNRYKFAEGIAFYQDAPEEVYKDLDLLRIYDALEDYTGPSFPEAREAFLARWNAVEGEIAGRAGFADLWAELRDASEEPYTARESERVAAAEQALSNALQDQSEIEGGQAELFRERAALRERMAALERSKPSLFARIFQRSKVRDYKAAARVLADKERAVSSAIASKEHALSLLGEQKAQGEADLGTARATLLQRREEWRDKRQRLASFRQRYGALVLPTSPAELEDAAFQLRGLWADPGLAKLRTRLFQAALALHEAWLAEVGKSKKAGGRLGFGSNIMALTNYLRQLPHLEDPEHARIIWQSLFMIVPVISTTFASLGTQFKGLGRESIGWLFIDEAGQAVPQAAVGALWRTRNAVVVGDPLQIEPVFTVPAQLIRSINALSPHTDGAEYSPESVSAQNLADACNIHGAYTPGQVPDERIWIGSPLRVHRRCLDPMFTVSNAIAYENRMIFGLKTRTSAQEPPVRRDSAWVDISGEPKRLQVVSEQVGFVCEIIGHIYADQGALPAFYVITPFKAIKREIHKSLGELDWASFGTPHRPETSELRSWCRQRVGTVHTFQGKEEGCVLFVLGAGENTQGAARWAASKPNLLNVAVTRAKRRCFIIGDKKLWGQLRYFSMASRIFGEASRDDVLRALQSDPTVPAPPTSL